MFILAPQGRQMGQLDGLHLGHPSETLCTRSFCVNDEMILRCRWRSVGWVALNRPTSAKCPSCAPSGGALARQARAGRAPGIFFDPCPTGDLLGGALSRVRTQCNYLDV